jgi:hypothetical protein
MIQINKRGDARTNAHIEGAGASPDGGRAVTTARRQNLPFPEPFFMFFLWCFFVQSPRFAFSVYRTSQLTGRGGLVAAPPFSSYLHL